MKKNNLIVLFYAFSNQWATNISIRTLLELQKIISPKSDCLFQKVLFHPQNFYNHYILNKKYDLIIGLGDFSGNIDHIRIETRAQNKYGYRPITPVGPVYLNLNYPKFPQLDSTYFRLGQNMGSYNCNWLAYKTQLFLNQNFLPTQHLFFHLPKKQSAVFLANVIDDLLTKNQMLQ